MCTTKLSPGADTGSPSASINIPELSIATCPCGSHSTRKMAAGLAGMIRCTSSRSAATGITPRLRHLTADGPSLGDVYRSALPQLGGEVFLTDSGLETDLIFNEGFELPEFAAFVLVDDAAGAAALAAYFRRHVDIAVQHQCGVILET